MGKLTPRDRKIGEGFERSMLPTCPPEMAVLLDLPPGAKVSDVRSTPRCAIPQCNGVGETRVTFTPGFAVKVLCRDCSEPILKLEVPE